jgi:CAAX protease family protein
MLWSPSLQLICLSLLKFFLLLFIVSIPFWLIGAITEMPKGIQINRLVSSHTAFNPLIAALFVTYAHGKSGGVKVLLERFFAYKGFKRWNLSIVLLMPTMMFLRI